MEPAATIDFGTIAEWINTAALVLFVYMFVKGTIIPKTVLDRIVGLYEGQAAALTEGILKRIDERFDRRNHDAKEQHAEVMKKQEN